MKKSIIAAALAGVMLLTGCSGVSEESYNSVVAENEKLKSEKSALESEKTKATSENADLQAKVADLEQQNSELQDQLNEQQNTSPGNSDATNDEMQEILEKYKKENFTVNATKIGNWYYTTNLAGLEGVTYIENHDLSNDDEFVKNAYLDMLNLIKEVPHQGMYSYTWAKENGENVGIAMFVGTSVGNVAMPITWIGELSRLNDNATNKSYSQIWTSNNASSGD